MTRVEKDVFRKGSTTYYWSSMFFPRRMRRDVAKLYSFVRVADDYVDAMPAREQDFFSLRRSYESAIADPGFDTDQSPDDSLNERVIKNMVAVERAYELDPDWPTAFLDSMQSDIKGRSYRTIEDTLEYVYGSAEVVGLMISRIFGLDRGAYDSARKLGRAMQYINFIRDVSEDAKLGRCYFPNEELAQFGLTDLSPESVSEHPEEYKAFIRAQIKQYLSWQTEAEQGFDYLPRSSRVPIKTASEMYIWTAARIAENPIAAYDRRIKPSRLRVVSTGIKNFIVP